MMISNGTPAPSLVRPAFPDVVVTPDDDWRALLRSRANALITGPADALQAFVDSARDALREPILSVSCDRMAEWPRAGTIVLKDVHLLCSDSQASLAAWLDTSDRSRTQIVSMTSVPLLPAVQEGHFDSSLYYRLNSLHFTVLLVDPGPGRLV